jgi:hypothetical protein
LVTVSTPSTLAEYYAWDYALSVSDPPPNLKTLASASTPSLDAVKAEIQAVIETAPVLRDFKLAAAAQLHAVFGVEVEAAVACFQTKPVGDAQRFGIPVPALKLKGNPKELAATFAAKVGII